MGALDIIIAKMKAKKSEGAGDGPASSDDVGTSSVDEYLGDAFDALKSGDKAGFVSAMKKSVCKEEAEEPTDDAEE